MTVNTYDAQQALSFLTTQAAYIEAETYRVRFPDIVYQDLIPLDFGAPEWISTIEFYSVEGIGQAKWFNHAAQDIPFATTERSKFEQTVYMAGVGYEYTLEELGKAQRLGMQLTAERAAAARRAYEEFMEALALTGDTRLNAKGLINNATVTTVTAAATGTGSATTFASKTPDNILADFNDALIGVYTGSKTVEMADTILLPVAQFASLTTRRVTDTSMTIFDFLMRANVYTAQTGNPLTVRALRQLSGAGGSGTDRMVVYRRDPQVLKMHVPMPHRFLAPQQIILTFKVPGIFRTAPVDIRLPRAIRYVDGI